MINETPGTPAEAIPFESILFADISLQMLNAGKYSTHKSYAILALIITIADVHRLDMCNDEDIVKAKHILRNSVIYN